MKYACKEKHIMVWSYPPVCVKDAAPKQLFLLRYLNLWHLNISGNSVFGLKVCTSETVVVVVIVLDASLVTRVLHTCS